MVVASFVVFSSRMLAMFTIQCYNNAQSHNFYPYCFLHEMLYWKKMDLSMKDNIHGLCFPNYLCLLNQAASGMP